MSGKISLVQKFLHEGLSQASGPKMDIAAELSARPNSAMDVYTNLIGDRAIRGSLSDVRRREAARGQALLTHQGVALVCLRRPNPEAYHDDDLFFVGAQGVLGPVYRWQPSYGEGGKTIQVPTGRLRPADRSPGDVWSLPDEAEWAFKKPLSRLRRPDVTDFDLQPSFKTSVSDDGPSLKLSLIGSEVSDRVTIGLDDVPDTIRTELLARIIAQAEFIDLPEAASPS